MVSAIARGLTKRGYEVKPCGYDVSELQAASAGMKIVIIYLGDFDRTQTDFLSAVSDIAKKEEALLYVVGNTEELEFAGAYIEASLITAKYERPLDTQLLASALDSVCGGDDQNSPARKSIMVIDDDGTMLRTIKAWLSDVYDVYMASSGQIALSFLNDKKVDLILLDYQMPEMDGPAVLTALKADPVTAPIPVMFLTGKSDQESLDRIKQLDAVKTLMKSQPREELLGEIGGFFTGRQ